jgi:hypothetical protein
MADALLVTTILTENDDKKGRGLAVSAPCNITSLASWPPYVLTSWSAEAVIYHHISDMFTDSVLH